MKFHRLLIAIAALLTMTACVTQPKGLHLEASGCSAAFADVAGGAFVMLETATGRMKVCDGGRASQAFVPASTFKVPHALIALELGVVSGADDVIEWDGLQRAVGVWNRDTTLATGLTDSTVWYYQAIAQRIGHSRMGAFVERLEFGNAQIGPASDLTHFWLDGDLRVSAFEQVAFLDRLRRGSLAASPQSQDAVRGMMKVRELPEGTLFAKSGLVLPIEPDTGDITSDPVVLARINDIDRIGWYVGWVERADETGGDVVFALNIDIQTNSDAAKRVPLAENLLQANGIIIDSSD